MMVAYRFDLPPLVDLRLLDETWDELWKDWNCDWRAMFVEGLDPPSWLRGGMVLSAAHVGHSKHRPAVRIESRAVCGSLEARMAPAPRSEQQATN